MKNFINIVLENRSILENEVLSIYDLTLDIDLSCWTQKEIIKNVNYILDEYE